MENDYTKMTVNERAQSLARELQSTRTELSRAFLLHHSYWYGSAGQRPSSEICSRIQVILPHLNINWLFNGVGEMWNGRRDNITDLLSLFGKNSPLPRMLEDVECTDAVCQYLADCGKNVDAFIVRYGAAYPALKSMAPAQPAVSYDEYNTDFKDSFSSSTQQPIAVTPQESEFTVSQLLELLANQQMLNRSLQDEIIRLNAIIASMVSGAQSGNNQ